jgi:hypothetical protein
MYSGGQYAVENDEAIKDSPVFFKPKLSLPRLSHPVNNLTS